MHFVWSTHKRERILLKSLKRKLISHYKNHYAESDIYIDTVNGDMEHIHLLVGLKPTQTASKVANQIKGESSNWINKNDFIKGKFAWQEGYSVFSVSESLIGKVREYIMNQEEHHRRRSYQEELSVLLKLHDSD